MRIYKYSLKPETTQVITLPLNAEFKYLDGMDEGINLWFAVNPDEKETEDVEFRIYPTGIDIPDYDDLEYLGTARVFEPNVYVYYFHVFVKPIK